MKDATQTPCRNCENILSPTDRYCRHCGQSAKTGRINLHILLHEIQHSIFHVDKGILYTIKELTVHPGKTLKNYLLGKRVNHFKPFGFVIILGTIYGFIAHFFNYYPETDTLPIINPESSTEYGIKTIELMYKNFSLAMLALVPFSALSSYIIFRKNGYNYMEHLVIYCYIVGMQILIMLFFYFFYYNLRLTWLHLVSSLISYAYNIWVFVQLFNKGSKLRTGLKAVLSIFFSTFLLLTTTFIVTFVVIFIAVIFKI